MRGFKQNEFSAISYALSPSECNEVANKYHTCSKREAERETGKYNNSASSVYTLCRFYGKNLSNSFTFNFHKYANLA